MPLLDETGDVLGTISGILINPDTGKVEGFFIKIAGFLRSEHLFLSSLDILSWGRRIYTRSGDNLAPIDDHIRLRALLAEGRTYLGARILTDLNRLLGRCRDVQFETQHFMLEWLFPKQFFRWRIPIPVSDVIEVKKGVIIVRDPSTPREVKAEEGTGILEKLPDIA
jgi:sporulation protein YlmC with PRC-barrel domain